MRKGKLMRDLAPDHEAHWFEIYGKVALTGESVHFENEAKALGRYYDVRAWRVGGAESRKVGILFSDIAARKQAETRLQAQLARLNLLQEITRAVAERQDLSSIFRLLSRRSRNSCRSISGVFAFITRPHSGSPSLCRPAQP